MRVLSAQIRLQFSAHMSKPPADLTEYTALVAAFVRKRHSLGLSQEEINAAAGFADGHLNKLEAFHRIAQLPTLQLWAQTLGLKITIAEDALPQATRLAIALRSVPLRHVCQTKRAVT